MPLNFHDKMIINSQNAYDIGAFELVSELSEKLRCIALLSNACKLLIDSNKHLSSKHLVPSYILHKETIDSNYKAKDIMDNSSYEDMMRINFNRFPQMYDRIDYYYVEYHKVLRTIIEFLMPEFHIDIHTYE